MGFAHFHSSYSPYATFGGKWLKKIKFFEFFLCKIKKNFPLKFIIKIRHLESDRHSFILLSKMHCIFIISFHILFCE